MCEQGTRAACRAACDRPCVHLHRRFESTHSLSIEQRRSRSWLCAWMAVGKCWVHNEYPVIPRRRVARAGASIAALRHCSIAALLFVNFVERWGPGADAHTWQTHTVVHTRAQSFFDEQSSILIEALGGGRAKSNITAEPHACLCPGKSMHGPGQTKLGNRCTLTGGDKTKKGWGSAMPKVIPEWQAISPRRCQKRELVVASSPQRPRGGALPQ